MSKRGRPEGDELAAPSSSYTMEQPVASTWYQTTVAAYVPTAILKNLFALPFRAADCFLRPHKIRVDTLVREDGACKKRIVDAGSGDASGVSETATSPRSRTSPRLAIPALPAGSRWRRRAKTYEQDKELLSHASPLQAHIGSQQKLPPIKNIFTADTAETAQDDKWFAATHRIPPVTQAVYATIFKKNLDTTKASPHPAAITATTQSVQDAIWSTARQPKFPVSQTVYEAFLQKNDAGNTQSTSISAYAPPTTISPHIKGILKRSTHDTDISMFGARPERHIDFESEVHVRPVRHAYDRDFFEPYADHVNNAGDGSEESMCVPCGDHRVLDQRAFTYPFQQYIKTTYGYKAEQVYNDEKVRELLDRFISEVKNLKSFSTARGAEEVAKLQLKTLHELREVAQSAHDAHDDVFWDILNTQEESSFLEELKHAHSAPQSRSFEEGDSLSFEEDAVDSVPASDPFEEEDSSSFEEEPNDVVHPARSSNELEETMLSLEISIKELAQDEEWPETLSTSTPPASPSVEPADGMPIPLPPSTIKATPLVAPLTTEEFDNLVEIAHKHGANPAAKLVKPSTTDLTTHDFGTLLPEMFNGDAKGWLNDNIINEYLEILVDHVKAKENWVLVRKGGTAPPVHAFKSQWLSSMKNNPDQVARWARPMQLLGEKFLDCNLVLIPICDNSHWRLLAIKPKDRLIEYYDSLHGSGKRYTDLAVEWIKRVLGNHYVESEWAVSEEQRSEEQLNASDCGVFTVLNALVLLRGEEHNRVKVTNGMSDARRRLATTLLATKPTTEMD